MFGKEVLFHPYNLFLVVGWNQARLKLNFIHQCLASLAVVVLALCIQAKNLFLNLIP